MIPPAERRGKILDVACGVGGMTNRLCRHFNAADITAINIAQDQLALAAPRVPEATFLKMDAADLQFDDGTFEHVICVEAAHHPNEDAVPGGSPSCLEARGYLILGDVLFAQGATLGRQIRYAILSHLSKQPPFDFPMENIVANIAAYTDVLWLAGFASVTVEDAVNRTWKPFYRNHRLFLLRKMMADPFRHGPTGPEARGRQRCSRRWSHEHPDRLPRHHHRAESDSGRLCGCRARARRGLHDGGHRVGGRRRAEVSFLPALSPSPYWLAAC